MSYINNPTIKNSAPFLGNDTAIKSLTLINVEGGQVLQTKDVSGRIRYVSTEGLVNKIEDATKTKGGSVEVDTYADLLNVATTSPSLYIVKTDENSGGTNVMYYWNGVASVEVGGATTEELDEKVEEAQGYAASALASKNAIPVSSQVYATDAAGRATVANGQTYLIKATGDNIVELRRRTDASNSTSEGFYPSGAAVNLIKWGNVKISGYNRLAESFGAIGFYEWDSKSGAQAANFSAIKVSDILTNTVSFQMITTGSFTDAAPQAIFTGPTTKRFAFASADEFKIGLTSNLANPSVLYFEYLDESFAPIVQFLYAQLNSGETKTITTSNVNVRYIQFVSAIFSYTADTGSSVPYNFSGASSSTFTMGIYAKGRSAEKALLTELTELHTSIDTNTSDITNLKNNAGSTCKAQISKGLYRFFNTCAVDSGANISASFDGNNPRFSKKSVRISVSGVTPIDNELSHYRGNISVTLDAVTVAKSMSFWLKVPSDYLFSSPRAGETSKVSFAQLDIDFYNGATLVRSKSIFPQYDIVPGWAFHKFYTSDFIGLTITKVVFKIKTYDKNPNMTFWVNSLVIDQMAIPTLTISSDNDWDDRTYASGWPTYVKNNNIPLSLRIYLDATSGSAAGRWLAKQLYESGQVDMGVYSGKARGNTPILPDTPLTTYSAIVDYLKSDSQNGRLTALNKGFPKRDLIESQNAINYLDDMLMYAEKEAGFKILRHSNSQAMTGFIDDLSPVIPCNQFGSFSTIGAINETLITTQINAGKLLIDRCIAYGSFGCMLVHQVVTQAQAASGDENLASLYEVMTGIMDYALTKVASGELQLMTNSGLYISCTK